MLPFVDVQTAQKYRKWYNNLGSSSGNRSSSSSNSTWYPRLTDENINNQDFR